MNYAVAVHNLFSGENKLHIVDGHTPADAMKEAIIASSEERTEEFYSWVKSLGETEESVRDHAMESELVISNIEEI